MRNNILCTNIVADVNHPVDVLFIINQISQQSLKNTKNRELSQVNFLYSYFQTLHQKDEMR
jgi:hypothetical protein